MLFVKLSSSQVKAYSYASSKLQNMVNLMSKARKTLEDIASSSLDKYFAKCMQLFASESLQFENEIHAQIDCFNCTYLNIKTAEKENNNMIAAADMESVCDFLEEQYIKSYRRLLKDKFLGDTLKSLISNQLQALLSSLAQLRLFTEVEPAM